MILSHRVLTAGGWHAVEVNPAVSRFGPGLVPHAGAYRMHPDEFERRVGLGIAKTVGVLPAIADPSWLDALREQADAFLAATA